MEATEAADGIREKLIEHRNGWDSRSCWTSTPSVPRRWWASCERSGFDVEEIVEREPYPDVEHQSRRCYVFARKPV